MRVYLDEGTKKFLADVKVDSKQFSQAVNVSICALPHLEFITVGNDETKVFRIFENKRGDIIISLSGMECIVIIEEQSLYVVKIPNSVYGNCSIKEARDILDGTVEPTEAFANFIKSANEKVKSISYAVV